MSIMSMLLGSGGAFTPLSLFAAGEQGVWYDPSDVTTMFEDAAGTTPVHACGNGTADSYVGLLLDKSKSGVGTNGAYRYNSVDYTEDFSNAYWTKQNIAISSSTETSPIGTSTACLISSGSGNAPHNIYHNNIATTPNAQYTLSFSAKLVSSARPYVCAWMYFSSGGPYVTYNLNDQTVASSGVVASNGTFVSSSITSQGNGWYRISITGYGNYSSIIPAIDLRTASSLVPGSGWTGSGLNDAYVWGIQLALTSSPSTYQNIPVTSWAATMAGNHATQSTSTARPTLSAKYNLATYTQVFTSTFWQRSEVAATDNNTTAPDGTTTACKVVESTNNTGHYIACNITLSAINYTWSVSLKYLGRQWATVSLYDGSTHIAWFDIQNGVVGTVNSGVTASITNQGNGWYRCTISYTPVAASCYPSFAPTTADGVPFSYVGDATKGLYAWGADLRVTNDGVGLPAYQRVVDANTYDSTGFPCYLKLDGVDDKLISSTVTLSSTNKLTGWLGYRLLSDTGNFQDLFLGPWHTSSAGCFIMYKANTSGLGIASAGTSTAAVTTADLGYAVSSLGSFSSDISAPSLSLRRNAALVSTSTASQGTGNYRDQVIYVGSDSSYAPSIRVYGAILRGASSTATEIANAESWMNGKAKIY